MFSWLLADQGSTAPGRREKFYTTSRRREKLTQIRFQALRTDIKSRKITRVIAVTGLY